METLTRGKLAKLANVNPETIRFYERQGILPHTARTLSGYRTYSPSTVDRIRFVAQAKNLGFTLNEVRDLLRLQDEAGSACLNVKMLLTEKLASVRKKRLELEALESQIDQALAKCNRSLKKSAKGESECPVFCCLSAHGDPKAL